MEINKLPNVNKHWIKNGYLNIELKTGDWIRLNFNNIQALKEQLTLTDVSQQRELLKGFRKWWNLDNQGVCTTITNRDIESYLKTI